MMVWVYSEICRDPILNERKKRLLKYLRVFGLSITVTTNVTSANYLDVNFDLTKDIYKPYRKPNDEPFISIDISTIPKTLYDKFHYQ